MTEDERSNAIARYTAIAAEHVDKLSQNAFNSEEEYRASYEYVMKEKAALMAAITGKGENERRK